MVGAPSIASHRENTLTSRSQRPVISNNFSRELYTECSLNLSAMEKEPQPESMATVTIKPEYAPSEYSSEPPPAYQKPKSSSVQIAKIVAVTVVLTAVVLGSFMLASAYVSANASCRQLEQELELLSEAADRLQPAPQAEALIQDEPIHSKRHTDTLTADEPKQQTKEIDNNSIDNESDSSSENSESDSSSDSASSNDSDEEIPIHLQLPLQLDLEQLAQALIEKNQKTKMNCVVEKKKAEEIVDHKPKTIRLPFGVNLTTDPRYEKLSGERMVIVCESGTLQRSQPPPPPPPPQQDDDDDQEEDTIMIQPVMIPIPQTQFQTHMPQQMAPPMMQNSQPMRPPMHFQMRPPMRPPVEDMRPPMPIMQIQIQQQQQPPQPQNQENDIPPSAIVHHIVQEIIARKIMEAQRAREEQLKQQQQQEIDEPKAHRFQMPPGMIANRIPIPEEIITQLNRLPNRDVIVAVSAESDESDDSSPESRSSEDNQITTQDIRPFPQQMRPVPQQMRPIPQELIRPMPQDIRPISNDIRQMPPQVRPFSQEMRPIPQEMRPNPQEIRTVQEEIPQQIRLIPHEIRVIPHVVSQEMQAPQEVNDHQEVHSQVQMRVVPQPPQETNQQEVHPQMTMHVVPQDMRFIQEQRTSAAEMNGRQGFTRALPVNIPVSMMPQEQEQDSQEPQAAASEEPRPHYVQPRSVRVEA